MKTIKQLVILLCIALCSCGCCSTIQCPTFDEQYLMFASTSDTTVYYSQGGDSTCMLSLKTIAEPMYMSSCDDCECSSHFTMELTSDKIQTITYKVDCGKVRKNYNYEISYAIYYAKEYSLSFSLTLKGKAVTSITPSSDTILVNGVVYNDVIKYKDRMYVSKNDGIIMINDKGTVWTLNRWTNN